MVISIRILKKDMHSPLAARLMMLFFFVLQLVDGGYSNSVVIHAMHSVINFVCNISIASSHVYLIVQVAVVSHLEPCMQVVFTVK